MQSHGYDVAERYVVRTELKGNGVYGLTFSSICASGPPPPSPFPKASRAVSLDSKFYSMNEQRGERSTRARYTL